MAPEQSHSLNHRMPVDGGIPAVTAFEGARPLATLVSPDLNWAGAPTTLDPDQRIRLSRFAHLRRIGHEMRVESPTTGAHLVVHDVRVAAVFAAFDLDRTPRVVADRTGISVEGILALLGLMAGAEIVLVVSTGADGDAVTAEDENVPWSWAFHDLLSYTQVRATPISTLAPNPGLEVLKSQVDLSPEPPHPDDVLLPAVNVAEVTSRDAPLGVALEQRESDRCWKGGPLPLSALAELLARVMHPVNRSIYENIQTLKSPTHRVYPAAGIAYEIDIAVLAQRVEGLTSGAYLYRAKSHSLAPLQGDATSLAEIIKATSQGVGTSLWGDATPQVLLVLAARFEDVGSRYSRTSYTHVLKNSGVMLQTLHLSASAMGLGSVIIGGGNGLTFAKATGLPFFRRGAVAEMAVSVRCSASADCACGE